MFLYFHVYRGGGNWFFSLGEEKGTRGGGGKCARSLSLLVQGAEGKDCRGTAAGKNGEKNNLRGGGKPSFFSFLFTGGGKKEAARNPNPKEKKGGRRQGGWNSIFSC